MRILGLLALAPALAVLAVPAATAETLTTPDALGNVEGTHFDPEPDPCGTVVDVDGTDRADLDIVSLSVGHFLRDLKVTVRFADLADPVAGDSSTVQVSLLTPRGDYDVLIETRPNGRVRSAWLPSFQSELAEAAEAGDECGFLFAFVEGYCRGLHADRSVQSDRVVVTIPRRCLQDPRAVRVAATSVSYSRSLDAFFVDEHADPGGRPERLRPWYGAWVRSSHRTG